MQHGFLVTDDSVSHRGGKATPLGTDNVAQNVHTTSIDVASAPYVSSEKKKRKQSPVISGISLSQVTANGLTFTDPEDRGRTVKPAHVFDITVDDGPEEEVENLAYKKVANKVRPVATTLPEDFRIVRREHPDPLKDMPVLPTQPPVFTPGQRFTQERKDALDINPDGFLWPEEEKLAFELLKLQEEGLAWTEMEKGALSDEFFDPVLIPTIEHVPWVLRNIPIPPGIFDDVVQIIKDKIASGIYEPSNSSYRSRWFCVKKKDGKSLRLVHDLQPLNGVSIKDAAVPPTIEHLAESFGGLACYTVLDLFVAFDQRKLDTRSRDITTFQTPLGTFRLTSIPMGYTNSFQIMHNDITFILKDEIPHITIPYADDVPVKGPKTRYEKPDGSYETIPDNPGIRRFVWEHLNDVNRIIQRVKVVGGTFSCKKIVLCREEADIVGNRCTRAGRIPDPTKVQKIQDWPLCRNVSEVRGFLGTCGVLRVFIKNYAMRSRPLVDLTRKDAEFDFSERQIEAMKDLKQAVIECPAIRPIDYKSDRPVILAVDSSPIGYGYILIQLGEEGQRFVNRFGSGCWNEREARYSQAKRELKGLLDALRSVRIFIIGVQNLVVEVDAKYIKGMINNPDILPDNTINRWIAGILLFHFKLVHVPADRHGGPDGLSRRGKAEEDPEEADDFDEWLDTTYAFLTTVSAYTHESEELPQTEKDKKREEKLERVRNFLDELKRPDGMSDSEFKEFVKYATTFFTRNGSLWRKRSNGEHQVIPNRERRLSLIREAHDELGHKGVYSVRLRLLSRFWWPALNTDVKWFIRTCHECQTRQLTQIRIPPTVATPAPLFRKAYADTMVMPKVNGFRYVVQARCSLTSYPEWRMLRAENTRSLANFILEELIYRWGMIEEIVTDNGPAYVAAVDYLKEKYPIHHIRISPYNSQANGIVERRHRDVREAIMKAAEGIEEKWPSVIHQVFWAERVTIQKATGLSPYYMAHGVEPLLPFDLAEATFMLELTDAPMTTAELLATRARALMRRKQDLDMVHERIVAARMKSAEEFMERTKHTMRNIAHEPGDLVLVRNSRVHADLNRKTKPRYIGPMVVVRRTLGGSYVLAELDGAIGKTRYAAFRLVPYHPRSTLAIPVTKLIEGTEGEKERMNTDDEADEEVIPELGKGLEEEDY